MSEYNCVVILGPTAVGKTSIGVAVARKFNGEIISADSRQTYKGLDLGSGKDLSEYAACADGPAVPYHLIDVAVLPDEYNVFNYQQDFYPVFEDMLSRKRLPVVVGGTGLYLDAVIRGYDLVDVPEDRALRAELEPKSNEELAKILLELKPDYHTKNDFLEKDRLIKAIEIAVSTRGERGQQLRSAMRRRPDIKPFIIGTTLPRPELWENIRTRLEERIKAGMVEEVRRLHDEDGISYERLEKLGLEYRYCSMLLENNLASTQEMTDKLFIAIRQFAKRQETWFRMMERKGVKINWLLQNSKSGRILQAEQLVGAALFGG